MPASLRILGLPAGLRYPGSVSDLWTLSERLKSERILPEDLESVLGLSDLGASDLVDLLRARSAVC